MVNITASGMFEPGGHDARHRQLPDEALEKTAPNGLRMAQFVLSCIEEQERLNVGPPPHHLIHCQGCLREITFYGLRLPKIQMCPSCETRAN